MTCRLFKTDPTQVTDVGIWLAKKLNSLADILWPFVTQKSYNDVKKMYDDVQNALSRKEMQFRGIVQELHEFEQWHWSQNTYLPFPSLTPNLDISTSMHQEKRFRFELNPSAAWYQLSVRNLRDEKYLTESVKESLIRLTKEQWSDKAEEIMRRYLKEIYHD